MVNAALEEERAKTNFLIAEYKKSIDTLNAVIAAAKQTEIPLQKTKIKINPH
jgi:multidrug resistance efflux pump